MTKYSIKKVFRFSSKGFQQSFPCRSHGWVQDQGLATLLLVEDNEEFRFNLKDSLQAHYHILEAANGKEGWQKALSGHPQLIVSDISKPYPNYLAYSSR
ncbi:hypothetical protein ACFGVR_04270 [Mucilaginibacter sp. AW1-3]